MNRRTKPMSYLIAAALAAGVVGPAIAAPEQWDIDPSHTSVTFTIRHIFAPVTGRFTESGGTLMYDASAPEKSSIEFTIPVASISTDNAKRDEHLRSDDFFAAAANPNITFKSTKIAPGAAKSQFKVTGDLTMRGVTKPVTLDVELLGFGQTPWGGQSGGFSVTGSLDRKEFGIQWNKALDNGGTLLGDEVKIAIGVEVAKHQAAK